MAGPASVGERVRDLVRARGRIWGTLLLLVLVMGIWRASRGVDAGGLEASLGAYLAREGLSVDAEGIVWLEEPSNALSARSAVFRASVEDGLPDLYYAEVRASGQGEIFDVSWLSNLTRTSSAAEGRPLRQGDHLVYPSQIEGRYDAFTVVDLRGVAARAMEDWPLRARLQGRITNLQETGRAEGFGRERYALRPPAASLQLEFVGDRLRALADEASIEVQLGRVEPLSGAERVAVSAWIPAEPGTLTWLVDTIRNLSFVGPEPIAWLEHRVFRVKDLAERGFYSVVETDTAAEVAEDLGVTAAQSRERLQLSVTDPELGWPPGPLEPLVRRPVEGEGQWIAIVDDPFVRAYPNAPPAFYQTFLQVDPDRPFTRVYVIVWDARQVQLRIMTGTREPESATGETGPGQVPRDPEVLRRVVGGFNGGFQALHGEFGMMSEGRTYLPPKPWAATVAVFDDGRVGMGSWMDPPEGVRRYRESWAMAQIPGNMREMRQNLTSVVEGERYNPWRRWWWGAAPQNADDQVFIDRSGLCLTREGFLAYFWGKSMGADELGAAMLSARCVRGIHLDMNSRHTGFEFYNVRSGADPHPPLERRPRRGSEFEQPVPGAEGWVMRGRKAVRSMTPMRFPRYMLRDARDFFYLTLRPTLPGPDLETADGPLRLATEGLPHAGWPHAFARAALGTGPAATQIVRIDPLRAIAAPLAGSAHRTVLAWLSQAATLPTEGGLALYAIPAPGGVGRRHEIGEAPEGATILLRGPALSDAHGAALGVDSEGFLLYMERTLAPAGGPASAPGLGERLEAAGVQAAIGLPEGVRLAFAIEGETVSPDSYQRAVDPASSLAFYAEEAPAAEILFPEVEPRPYMYWYRLQDTRVRYLLDEERPRRFQAPPEP